MTSPIYDFVSGYISRDVSRLHMPGHKGIGPLSIEPRDITEVCGADVLYSADGIIAESEHNAAALFGTGKTLYSTEGSSHVIKAMLYLALQQAKRKGLRARPVVLAARNVHKSFVYACALLDLDVEWVYPARASSVCSCQPDAEGIRYALSSMQERPVAVYITSPDYLGTTADIRAIASVCGEIPLLVDNAHGAYLHFLSPCLHPIDLGAYMCADSAHKTLPVLTGGAYLHMSCAAAADLGDEANEALSLFGSTSPSYLILQSLDLANRYLADGYKERLAVFIKKLDALKSVLCSEGVAVLPSEPLKLVVASSCFDMSGAELADHMRRYNIEPEFADIDYLVFMLTPDCTDRDLERLRSAFAALYSRPAPIKAVSDFSLPPMFREVSIREAILSAHEYVNTADSVGRICASPSVSCPPAVPIVISGERISPEAAGLFTALGIDRISVIK